MAYLGGKEQKSISHKHVFVEVTYVYTVRFPTGNEKSAVVLLCIYSDGYILNNK